MTNNEPLSSSMIMAPARVAIEPDIGIKALTLGVRWLEEYDKGLGIRI